MNINSALFGKGLLQKDYFNLSKVFVLRLFKIVENQSGLGLNRGLVWLGFMAFQLL